ncbi:MAG: phosrestin [Proteobacteria bacterium]|nr:phosrestin [Pseudomonadota bacterium]
MCSAQWCGRELESFKVQFDLIEWQCALPGARFKAFRDGSKQLRLLEFTSEFVEPEWCEKGHVGIVLKGELEIDFQGSRIRYPEGSGIFIPSGTSSSHKARAISPSVLLFLVEEV